jgi:hypothetical protein
MSVAILKPSPLINSGEFTKETVEAYSAAMREPAWMTARRLDAWRLFKDTPAPNRHDELWRRVDLSQFKLDQLLPTVRADGRVPLPPAGWAPLATADNAHWVRWVCCLSIWPPRSSISRIFCRSI